MDPVTLASVVAGVAGWLSGVLGSFLAVRTELRWLRRDVDKAHERLDVLQGLRIKGAV